MSGEGRAEPTAVVLRGVPVRLILRSDDHRRDVLRELALLRLGASPQRRHDHGRLAELERTLTEADRRLCGGDRAVADRAFTAGTQRLDVLFDAPPDADEVLARWREAITMVGTLRPPLLIPPPGREIVLFHDIWAAEVAAQLAGAGASPDPFAEAWALLRELILLDQVPSGGVPTALPHARAEERVAHVGIGPHPSEVGKARAWLRDTLVGWGADDVADEAALPFSELVTNALLHAEGRLEACVAVSSDHVRVEVRDGSVHTPVRRLHSLSSATGRGLELVEMLCARWGVVDLEDGKRIWFEVDRDPLDATG